jgi:hypothetical protein
MEMRNVARTFVVLVAVGAVACATNKPTLGFYPVSSELRPGLHRIESSSFSKLGYIADDPEFVISRLEEVSLRWRHGIHKDRVDFFAIKLTVEDAKALADFTKRHTGEVLLLQLGHQPLLPMPGARMLTRWLWINVPDGMNRDRLKQQLETLVQPADPT